jgi:hypothetical protein
MLAAQQKELDTWEKLAWNTSRTLKRLVGITSVIILLVSIIVEKRAGSYMPGWGGKLYDQ